MESNLEVVKKAIIAMIETDEFNDILIKYLEAKGNASVEGLEIKSGGGVKGVYIEIK